MTIFYSCVVDSGERSLWQLKVWILGLTHLAGVPSERLCVHVLGKNAAAEDYLAANGIRYKHVERFGDGRFCNKLSQCASSLFTGADYVFLCDCDTVCLENIEDCAHMQNISGKIVDMPYPPLSILEKIFDEYAVPKPPVLETLTGRSLSNNFNGGLYGIPLLLFDTLGRLWKEYAQSLLTNKNMKCSTFDKRSLMGTVAEAAFTRI